ncbi:MAG: FecR family protein [Saprospiraceae bacterium]
MQQPMTADAIAADEQFQQHCLQPSAESEQYWNDWLKQFPDQQENFLIANQIVRQLGLKNSEQEAVDEWVKLAPKLSNRPTAKTRQFSNYYRWRVAASILFLIGLLGWYQWSSQSQMQQIATGYGETTTVTLPDGSEVYLNANSSVSYPIKASNEKRELNLSGEAYFKIVHDPQRPFTVSTEQGEVQVLGTTFNVQQRAKKLTVTLTSGKVQINTPTHESTFLQPGERAVITLISQVVGAVDTTAVIAWRDGKLVFNKNTVAEIIAQLEQEYNWEIDVFNHKVLTRTVTASVPRDNPTLLLEALHEIYDLNFEKVGEQHYELH